MSLVHWVLGTISHCVHVHVWFSKGRHIHRPHEIRSFFLNRTLSWDATLLNHSKLEMVLISKRFDKFIKLISYFWGVSRSSVIRVFEFRLSDIKVLLFNEFLIFFTFFLKFLCHNWLVVILNSIFRFESSLCIPKLIMRLKKILLKFLV